MLPHFDCRVGSFASWEEARSLLLWRAYDCSVNGVSDAVYHIKGSGKAIQGLVVMSAQLDAMYANLLFQQVPGPWGEGGKGYPSLKPLAAWVNDFIARLTFVQKWYDEGKPPAYWISGFYFPQAFLTGTLQNYARKYQVAIDSVNFDFTVLQKEGKSDIQFKPHDGVYIYGLFLDGCRWDKPGNKLADSVPKVLFAPLPVLLFLLIGFLALIPYQMIVRRQATPEDEE